MINIISNLLFLFSRTLEFTYPPNKNLLFIIINKIKFNYTEIQFLNKIV